jgi:hypothetical protein
MPLLAHTSREFRFSITELALVDLSGRNRCTNYAQCKVYGFRAVIRAHEPTRLHIYRRVANLETEQWKTDDQLTKLERLLERLEGECDHISEMEVKLGWGETP